LELLTVEKELIPYNDKLIEILEADHKILLKVYTEIMEQAGKKDYSSLTTLLKTFLKILRKHLSKERIDLYMYIELVLSKKLKNYDKKVFRDLRLELSTIAIKASSALNQYIHTPVTDKTVKQFTKDFTALGGVLVNRIEREEKNIFPIYSNSAIN